MALLFEVEDRVATITFNRPEVMNAMDKVTYEELSDAWITVRDNPEIWAAIVTGSGDRAFTSGADLREVSSMMTPKAWEFWQTQADQLLNRGLEVWKPVIAAVNGYCLGGGVTLLLATDIRIASETATFALSEVKRGFLPANGGTQRTIRQMPYPVAMEFLLTGDPISAQRAKEVGLINEVVAGQDLMARARAIAQRICKNGPLAARAIKELAIRSQYMNLADGLRMEQAMSRVLATTEDAHEGPRAFAEKRPAQFQGV